MKLYRVIYRLGMFRSKEWIKQKYGKADYSIFASHSKKFLELVIQKTPDIGNTIFSFNYAFTPAYIAWYKGMDKISLSAQEKNDALWLINQRIITTIPKWMASVYAKAYLNNFRKKAPIHQALISQNKVHDYDYLLSYKDIDKNTFEIEITRCGMMTLAADFNALGIFPTVCRVDYMMSNYMGAGFERTKTLGDGDACCNCRYIIGGDCEWSPEKGFAYRK